MKQLDMDKTIILLKKYNLPFSKPIFVNSQQKVAKASQGLSFPIVMKIASSDIIHKSDVDGVKTCIKNASDAEESYAQIVKSARKKAPKARIKGAYMQKMEQGTEVIIGMKRDAQFGPVIMFGIGGVFVEIMKDTSFSITPVDRKMALEMIKSIKSYPMLSGARGRKPVSIDAIADIIVKTSKMTENKNIMELDFNPVMANESSAVIVDARIIVG
ncbi:acetyl-CoA synthetase [Candidatus Woesearchaeota archaeon CG10_big_fil_rev_8_21_14_0_10_44_13]|nr:MAG: acetyl-CoA synthetase [Candidatus Woesearchaeota archaeon CG10_big_fil_rev_8_21_14_0_10_44_13]